MSQINYNRDAIAESLALKLSRATGISEFSNSSKVKLMSDIFAEENTNLAESYNLAVDGLYSETAEGEDLDLKGAQYGIYRKSRNSIYIDKSDAIMAIRPNRDGDTFGDSVRQPLILAKGERIELGSSFFLITSEDIYIMPADSQIYISGTLLSEDGVGFIINSGDSYKLSTRYLREQSLDSLVINFKKPISVNGEAEDDDSFRVRVILARDGDNVATTSAVQQEILSQPDISGLSFLENMRGSGSLDVGITSELLQESGEDINSDSMIGLLRTDLLSVLPFGVDLEIFIPERLELLVEFQREELSNISKENIESSILEAFYGLYRYSSTNSLSLLSIEEEVNTTLDTSIKINSMSLLDSSIGAILTTSSNTIVSPIDNFMFLERSNITEVEDE